MSKIKTSTAINVVENEPTKIDIQIIRVHLEKYLKSRSDLDTMQISWISAKVKRLEMRTYSEWDQFVASELTRKIGG